MKSLNILRRKNQNYPGRVGIGSEKQKIAQSLVIDLKTLVQSISTEIVPANDDAIYDVSLERNADDSICSSSEYEFQYENEIVENISPNESLITRQLAPINSAAIDLLRIMSFQLNQTLLKNGSHNLSYMDLLSLEIVHTDQQLNFIKFYCKYHLEK